MLNNVKKRAQNKKRKKRFYIYDTDRQTHEN